jgi:polysaccharide pyruvyl transferase WcaK-like protein
MATEPKLIGFFGLFGIGNIGNDGSLESMLRFARRVAPERDVLCICGNPAVVERDFSLEAVPIYPPSRLPIPGRGGVLLRKMAGRAGLWLHAMRQLRRLEVLIVPGMGVLDDFAVSPLGWPQDILSWCVLGRLLGVKIIFASIGAGPIHHPLSRVFMKMAARAAHYRSYRDTVSKAFMESIGFDACKDPIYPDIAFALPAPAATRKPAGRPLTIGVGIMTYQGWRNDPARGAETYTTYLEEMTRFVIWLLERGYLVRVLMGDEADRRAIDDLLAAVRARRPDDSLGEAITFAPARTLHDVMQQMADTDIVVATRYHNVVCALRMCKPTISIGYAEKNDALLREVGLAEFCQHVEHLDLDLLQAQTARLIADRATFESKLRDALARFQSRLREQEDLIADMICSGSRSPAVAAPDRSAVSSAGGV